MRILQHTKEDEAKYLKFLLKHERSNFQQSLEWGNIKTNWIKEVIISEDEKGKIVGALCVWIRKIPLFGNIMYSARGPVCDIHSKEQECRCQYRKDEPAAPLLYGLYCR